MSAPGRDPGKTPGRRDSQGTAITRVKVATDRGVFMISVAAELADMHPQTLRVYEARGLIEPRRSPKGTRLYSHEDVERLRRIQGMTAELGLNLAGVERVLDLENEIQRMHARIEELERQALHTEVRLAQEMEQLRRSFRAELAVPYRGGELVRLADVRSLFKIRVERRDDGS
jgi:MerR family transcriptional regulator/heat shock protein HspR